MDYGLAAARAARAPSRRRVLQAGLAAIALAARPLRAAEAALPDIPALAAFLAGRVPRFARVRLDLPSLADNGFAVPMRVSVTGPFAPGPFVQAIRLFSETNPVPEMAVFEFPAPLDRVELDARIRLAGTQRLVTVAHMSDDTLLAAATEVVVTLAGCMDGT